MCFHFLHAAESPPARLIDPRSDPPVTSQRSSALLRGEWRTRVLAHGDFNAFFGLMLDNVGDMILMSALLVGVYGFPRDFVIGRMIPGTAVGVLVGDLIYTGMAI